MSAACNRVVGYIGLFKCNFRAPFFLRRWGLHLKIWVVFCSFFYEIKAFLKAESTILPRERDRGYILGRIRNLIGIDRGPVECITPGRPKNSLRLCKRLNLRYRGQPYPYVYDPLYRPLACQQPIKPEEPSRRFAFHSFSQAD